MTIEEEVRSFAEKYIPNGAQYLASAPVPAFKGTWQDVFTGKIRVDEKTQRRVLRQLRDIFGNKEPWGGRRMP